MDRFGERFVIYEVHKAGVQEMRSADNECDRQQHYSGNICISDDAEVDLSDVHRCCT